MSNYAAILVLPNEYILNSYRAFSSHLKRKPTFLKRAFSSSQEPGEASQSDCSLGPCGPQVGDQSSDLGIRTAVLDPSETL